jgi:hypothetical protein
MLNNELIFILSYVDQFNFSGIYSAVKHSVNVLRSEKKQQAEKVT